MLPPDAVLDFFYLMNRGYPRKSSARLVSSRYGLTREQASLLERCVHEEPYNQRVKEKLFHPRDAPVEFLLVIDLYNVTSLIMEALSCRRVYRCTDHVLRDNARAEARSWKDPSSVAEAMARLSHALKPMSSALGVIVVADKQVSHSRVALRIAEETLSDAGVKVLQTALARRADAAIIEKTRSKEENLVVLTSDRLLLENVPRVLDPHALTPTIPWEKVVDLRKLVEQEAFARG